MDRASYKISNLFTGFSGRAGCSWLACNLSLEEREKISHLLLYVDSLSCAPRSAQLSAELSASAPVPPDTWRSCESLTSILCAQVWNLLASMKPRTTAS